jgi:hypothetical protein
MQYTHVERLSVMKSANTDSKALSIKEKSPGTLWIYIYEYIYIYSSTNHNGTETGARIDPSLQRRVKERIAGVRLLWRNFCTHQNPSQSAIQCGILNISQPYRPPRPVTEIDVLYEDGVCFLWGTNWTVSTATSSQYLAVNCEMIV